MKNVQVRKTEKIEVGDWRNAPKSKHQQFTEKLLVIDQYFSQSKKG
ncbi:hypothetical protein J2X69_003031 [Algoriphagus sp. 4150]|nr:hypothetical protein [Algoriphagus sp. 4150]MDR7130674.1 hypothetical protein [Algoriphagus sp. 4150]